MNKNVKFIIDKKFLIKIFTLGEKSSNCANTIKTSDYPGFQNNE